MATDLSSARVADPPVEVPVTAHSDPFIDHAAPRSNRGNLAALMTVVSQVCFHIHTSTRSFVGALSHETSICSAKLLIARIFALLALRRDTWNSDAQCGLRLYGRYSYVLRLYRHLHLE